MSVATLVLLIVGSASIGAIAAGFWIYWALVTGRRGVWLPDGSVWFVPQDRMNR